MPQPDTTTAATAGGTPPPTDATDVLDTLSAIEEANVGNILAKLKAGKVLTDRETKLLADYQAKQAAATTGAARAAAAGQVADSMEQAVALTGIPKDRLQSAKAAGCSAFRGSRVYVDELITWLEENEDTLPTGNKELDEINLAIAREKLRKSKFANDVEEGRYILADSVAVKAEALGLELKAVLRKRLEDEFPDRQANRSREEILSINRALVDELCLIFREGASRWAK